MNFRAAISVGLAVAWTCSAPAGAFTLDGVKFAERHVWNGTPLRLHGAGVLRYRLFIKEYVSRNVDDETLERIASSMQQLNRLYAEVQPGDRYSPTYAPGVGTELALNGEPRGLIEGAELASALFAIWLGEDPANASLRKMLPSRF
jgi:hypothetical protein